MTPPSSTSTMQEWSDDASVMSHRRRRRSSKNDLKQAQQKGKVKKWWKGLWANLRGLHPTKWAGGGRDWVVDPKTGRIYSKTDPSLYLAVSPTAPLVLVKKGSPDQLSFDPPDSSNTMQLMSRDGYCVGLKTREVQHWNHKIRYIEAVVAQSVAPATVYIVANSLLYLPHLDLALDVAWWKFKEGNAVNFAGGPNREATLVHHEEPGTTGRDWIYDPDDGTLSPVFCPGLVLGRGARGLVLTDQPNDDALVVRDAAALAKGQVVPLILNDGQCIGTTSVQAEGQWIYRQSIVKSRTSEAARIRWDGNFIVLEDEKLVLDVAYWQFFHGNSVNFAGSQIEFKKRKSWLSAAASSSMKK
eukprot:CAMPEP_0116565856 /NCGR_PEP_ID=MMETSP0397-20121206/14124_1 /TAXON_ID=216820 /ORGANISM="Cyclophora tenuis, Strain ECT3854" /LENGTH=356 /DNA_ID=CAMNT_0004092663 /DNA_START=160 /DNA_END=1226 /DNA_ORIENTATION=+